MRSWLVAKTTMATMMIAAAFSCGGSSSDGAGKTSSSRNAVGDCNTSTGSGESCPGDDAYEKCVMAACDAKYQECFGPAYATGTYAGLCGPAISCYMGCPCGDTACESSCFTSASQACIACAQGTESCKDASGCTVPVCPGTGGSGQGGSGQGGGTGGTEVGGSAGTDVGGSAGTEVGGSGGGTSVCPYTVPSMECPACCEHLKTVAAKCKDDPSLSEYTRAVLAAAAVGNGAGCKTTCAVDSQSYPALWACFQGVPVEADCTAIAGCTMGNCL